jgi:SAM-dependent methyltransferase
MAATALTRWFRRGRAATLLAPTEAYELWADTYPPYPHNPLMEAEQAVVAPIISACAPRTALDVGTGTGRNISLLRRAGARTVVALDRSRAMLRQHAGGPASCARVCADACALPFPDGHFDLVCSSLMAGDLPDLGAFLHDAGRVLARGGHLVYSDFHPEWAPRGWRRTFTARDGQTHELSYIPHTLADHLARVDTAGLSVRSVREPRLSGRAAPVVIVLHLEKVARRYR